VNTGMLANDGPVGGDHLAGVRDAQARVGHRENRRRRNLLVVSATADFRVSLDDKRLRACRGTPGEMVTPTAASLASIRYSHFTLPAQGPGCRDRFPPSTSSRSRETLAQSHRRQRRRPLLPHDAYHRVHLISTPTTRAHAESRLRFATATSPHPAMIESTGPTRSCHLRRLQRAITPAKPLSSMTVTRLWRRLD